MNREVMFGKATDEWSTPEMFFAKLDAEFDFQLDAAATDANAKCGLWLGPGHLATNWRDGLAVNWAALLGGTACAVWLNPPYSRCREFIAKAAQEARRGATVVCLVPSRTDTRWWHEHVYDASRDAFRPGVEVRFVKGRLKFGNSTNSAPFPSVVIVFRPCSVEATKAAAVDPHVPMAKLTDDHARDESDLFTYRP